MIDGDLELCTGVYSVFCLRQLPVTVTCGPVLTDLYGCSTEVDCNVVMLNLVVLGQGSWLF